MGQRFDDLSVGNRDDIHDLLQAAVDYRCVPSSRHSHMTTQIITP